MYSFSTPPAFRWGTSLLLLLLGSSVWTGGLAWGQQTAPRSPRSVEEGQMAPNFALKTIHGDTFHLREHRGEVVVLNFWATWCPPCRREIPGFVELQRERGDQGVQFIGVALQRRAGVDDVRVFARQVNINYPVGVGDGTIARKYGGIRSLPSTFVIGPEGKIREYVPSMISESRLWSKVKRILEGGEGIAGDGQSS